MGFELPCRVGVGLPENSFKSDVTRTELDLLRGTFSCDRRSRHITDADKLRKGTLITVIGEVKGLVSTKLDRDTLDVPALVILDMTAWDRQVGMTHYHGASPLVGYRPFIFWDSRRVAGQQ